MGFDPALVDRIGRMVATSEFKRQVPPVAKLARARRASTTSTRGAGPAPRDGEPDDGETGAIAADRADAGEVRGASAGRPRDSLRRRDAHRQPRRRHAAIARGPCGRCRSSRRRTRGSRAGSSPVMGSRRTSCRTMRARRRRRSTGSSRTFRSGRDLALVTDAGTPLVSDPGAGLVSAWAAESAASCPSPGPRRSSRARGLGDRGAALELRGLPAATRARTAGAACPARRGRTDGGALRGARPPRGHARRPCRGLRRRATRGGLPRASRSSTRRPCAAASAPCPTPPRRAVSTGRGEIVIVVGQRPADRAASAGAGGRTRSMPRRCSPMRSRRGEPRSHASWRAVSPGARRPAGWPPRRASRGGASTTRRISGASDSGSSG